MASTGLIWLIRVGAATAALAGVGLLADPAREVAAGSAAGGDAHAAIHAMALFAIVWFIASLRLRRHDGLWRLGFDPAPVRRIADSSSRKRQKPASDSSAGF